MPIIYRKINDFTHLIWNKDKRNKFDGEFIYSSGGSWFEKDKDRGKKHLMEHCIVGRTTDMNFTEFKDYQFKENIFFNAYTSSVTMGLSAYGHNSNDLEIIKTLLQMGVNPIFDQEILDQEKQIVLREIVERSGEPSYKLHFQIMSELFTHDSLENHQVLGSSEMVSQTTIEDFYSLHQSNIQQSHLLICLSGESGRNQEEVIDYLNGFDFKIKDEPKLAIDYAPANNFQEFSFKPLVSEFAHEHAEVALYIPFKVNFGNKAILKIFYSLFFSFYGIVYDKLRNELGLIYSLYANFDSLTQSLSLNFSCETKYVSTIYNHIVEIFGDFEKVFEEKKLDELKNNLTKQILISSDNLTNQTQFVYNSLLNYGIYEDYNSYLKRLQDVSKTDIKNVFYEIKQGLRNKRLIVSSRNSDIEKIVVD